ncbi:MAG: ATP-binding cassette domain-containing protein [Kiritimatiellae bacterium]|jgi:ABC-type branched-subunit amino acid transport system ATPase component|nr:ATP-binding cassette domain-containing protein [Kiritimatiellia bacterium]
MKNNNHNILEIKNVNCGYGSRPVLHDISLNISVGETVLLAGPNGCGKSTLLKAIVGMLPIETGSIEFSGKQLKHQATEKRINAGIGYLQQTNNIFSSLSVKENLEIAGLSFSKNDFDKNINRVLSIFDFLNEILGKRAGLLSGGQRQALAISMVLLHPKKLYLLDEPTAGLSPKAAKDIMQRLENFAMQNKDVSILIVEHRLELLNWIDRAVVLVQGKVKIETEDTNLLFNPKWLAEHYF